jgi:hypothetical protein
VKTVKQVVAEMDGYTDEDRVKYVRALVAKLSVVSEGTLYSFQNEWDGSRPYSEFVTEQNKVIRQCVTLELKPEIGGFVRESLGLEPLTEDTEVA